MARGWESKAIESQQDDVLRGRQTSSADAKSEPSSGLRRTLELARTRTASQLEVASLPHHRTMLERAIADLDARLESLDHPD